MRVNWPFPDPARVVVAGDWHGSTIAARNAFSLAESVGASLVVQLGDFGMWPGFEGAAYLATLNAYAEGYEIPLAWIDGNHEDFAQLLAIDVDPTTGLRVVRPSIFHIPRGSSWEWHDVRFRALGGATSLDRQSRTIGKSWWMEEAVTDEDIAAAVEDGECDVLLLHDCPTGVDIPGIHHRSYKDAAYWPVSELERAWDHRDRVAEVVAAVKPSHIWHGHFHARYKKTVDLSGASVSVEGLADDGSGPTNNLMVVELCDGSVRVLSVNEALYSS